MLVKLKVKVSNPWTGPEGSRRSRLPDFQTVGTCKVVRASALCAGRLYTPPPQKVILVLISVKGWVDFRVIVRSQRLSQWKIPETPPGVRLVAQCLNQMRHQVPPVMTGGTRNCNWCLKGFRFTYIITIATAQDVSATVPHQVVCRFCPTFLSFKLHKSWRQVTHFRGMMLYRMEET